MWAAILQTATGILFPRTCCGCDGTLTEGGTDFCAGCGLVAAMLVGRPYCTRCGRSAGLYELPDGVCVTCRKNTPLTSGLVRVGGYEGPLKRIIIRYKFHARHDLEGPAVRMLSARLEAAAWLVKVDALVPVPTHWTRRSIRGEHLADRLARGAARSCGLSYQPVLRRIRGGPNQYELQSSAERVKNVRGAFATVRGARLKGARLCVVDDLSTTGATLAEVRRILRAAGAAEVYAAIFVKAG